MRRQLLALYFLSALCRSAVCSSPELTTILPRGGQRGSEVVVEFTGDRLGDAAEVIFHEPGISVVKIEPAQKVVKATLKIEGDCPLGEHAMRVRTATGLSPLRTFWVGALPIVSEKEPNNDPRRAQEVPLNCTVHGSISAEDVDCFTLQLKKDQRLTIEVEAMRLGGGFFDAHVSVLDAQRKEIFVSDDTTLTRQDPCGSLIIPDDGTYFICIRESARSAGDQYRLHVGTMPRPMTVFPLGGVPGKETEVTFLGDSRGPVTRRVQLPDATANGRWSLWFDDDDGVSPSPIPFRLSQLGNVIESEPNDSAVGARLGVVPCAFNGIIEKPRDRDLFRFWAKKGQVYDVQCFGRKFGSPIDPVLWVAGMDGKVISWVDDVEGNPDSFIRFTAPDDKEYLVGIRDQLDRGGPEFVYRIEVSAIQPRIEMSLARVAEPPSQERLTVTVPRGNRIAALVNIRRIDGGGELRLECEDLPENVKVSVDPVSASQSVAPVLLEANADATVASTLVNLLARTGDSKQEVPARYEQPIVLVYYAGQTVFHAYRSERLPIAIAEAVPFQVSIVEPRVPLVRGGTMQLKVVTERTGDFKGPIRIQPLYNPSGVSAPGEVTIPESQTEVMMPLTANATAGIGQWKYAVIATADLGGAARVSSQLATLNVAQPFVRVDLERAKAEQGSTGTVRGKVTIVTPFEGTAKVQLMGLPPKVKAQELEITADTKEVSFPVAVDATCNPGPLRNLFCQVSLVQNGEAVVQNSGTTELRVDVPLKKKSAANANAAAKP